MRTALVLSVFLFILASSQPQVERSPFDFLREVFPSSSAKINVLKLGTGSLGPLFQKSGGSAIANFANFLRPMTKLIARYLPRLLKHYALYNVTLGAATRTTMKLLRSMYDIAEQFGVVKTFVRVMAGERIQNWEDFRNNLVFRDWTPEVTARVNKIAKDPEVIAVVRAFFARIFLEDPSIADDLIAMGQRHIKLIQSGEPPQVRWSLIKRNDQNLRKERAWLFDVVAQSPLPDTDRQKHRWRYRRWRRAWNQMFVRIREEFPKELDDVLMQLQNFSTPRSEEVTDLAGACVADQGLRFDPFRFTVCRSPRPPQEYIPWLVLFSLVVLASLFCGATIIYGLIRHKQKPQIILSVLLGGLFVAAVLRLCYFSFWTITIGDSFPVSILASDTIERVAGALFSILFVVFTFFLVRANVDTFLSEESESKRKMLLLIITIAFGVLVGGVLVYCIVMTVLTEATIMSTFVLDGSRFALSLLSAIMSIALVLAFVATMWNLRRAGANKQSMFRAILFAACSVVLAMMFITVAVITGLFTFASVAIFSKPLMNLQAASEVLFSAAILGYCFWSSLVSFPSSSSSKGDYESFISSESSASEMTEDVTVPLIYNNFE